VARLKRVAAVLALAVLIAAVPGAAHAEKTIGLSSGTFSFDVDPGVTGAGEVVVMNEGDEPLKVLVYVADVEIDAKGEQTFVTPQRQGGSLLSTPASWFRIYMPADSRSVGNTPYVELDVGEELPIRFDFTPPPGVAPGDHNTIIFFEMFEFANATAGAGSQVSGRLGTRVALRVSGQVVEKMSLRPFEVPPFMIGQRIPYSFVVNNEGNLNQRVQVTASVLNRSEEVVVSSTIATDTAMYAESGRQFTGELLTSGTLIGPFTIEVRVDHRADGQSAIQQVIEERTVWLVPLWVVVLAGFLLVYFVGYLIFRMGKRARESAGKPVLADPISEEHGGVGVTSPVGSASEEPYANHSVRRGSSRKQREAEAAERRRRRVDRTRYGLDGSAGQSTPEDHPDR
jgi:hypothetical protein